MQREGKRIFGRFGRHATIGQAFKQRLQPQRRGCSAAPAKPGVQSFRRRCPITKPCCERSKGRFMGAKGDLHIKFRGLLHFLQGIDRGLQRRSIGGLGTLRECGQRCRAMGFGAAVSEKSSASLSVMAPPSSSASTMVTARL